MRNTFRLFGIIALAAVIGLSMAACDNGSTSPPGGETPALGDYNITGLGTYTYDGSAKQVTITPKEGKSGGAVTVYYKPKGGEKTTTAPSAIGTYTVTFDVEASGDYGKNAGLYAGDLIINPAGGGTPVASDFDFSGQVQLYDGNPKKLGIAPKANKSTGAITPKYALNGGTPTAQAPSEAGSYAVTFDVAPSTDGVWSGASNLEADMMQIIAWSEALAPVTIEHFIIQGLGDPYVGLGKDFLAYEDGTERVVYVSAVSGGTLGTRKITYENLATGAVSEKPPVGAGEYKVWLDVEASPPWAEFNAMLAKMVIRKGFEVTREMFDISGLSQAWDGNTKPVIITPKYGYHMLGNIQKFYKWPDSPVWSTTVPHQVGSYEVAFDVTPGAGTNYRTAEKLAAGTLVISQTAGTAAPVQNDYTYETLGNYNFDYSKPIIISVIPKDGADGSGQIKVKYNKINADGTKTAVTDTSVWHKGTYEALFDVGASANKAATVESIKAGEFTVQAVFPNAGDFYLDGSMVFTYDGTMQDVKPYIKNDKLGPITNSIRDVKYNGEIKNNGVKDAGTYAIVFELGATDDWENRSNVALPTDLYILKGRPQPADYTVNPAARKEYDGTALSGTTVLKNAGSRELSDGAVTILYNGQAGDPVNAGTYNITLSVAGTDNWDALSGITTGAQVIIDKKTPTWEVEFKITSGSLTPTPGNAASGKIVVGVDTSAPLVFEPRTTVPAVTYVNSSGVSSGTNPTAPGNYKVVVTVPAPADPSNWNGARFELQMTVGGLVFTTINDFEQWMGRADNTSGSNFYSVKLNVAGLATADFQKIARILKSTTNRIVASNSPVRSNLRKNISLDLSDSTIVSSPAVDLTTSHGPYNADENDYGIDAAFSGFAGCTNLYGLKLPNSGSGSITFGDTVFGDSSANPSTLTTRLAELDLGIVSSLGGNGTALRYLSNLRTLGTGKLPTLTSGGAVGDTVTPLANLRANVNITKLILGPGWTGLNASGNPTYPFRDNKYLVTLELTSVASTADSGLTTTTAAAAFATGGEFQNCTKLESVTFPAGWNMAASVIPDYTFYGCAALKNVTFPTTAGPGTDSQTLTVIGKGAFSGTALTSIDMRKIEGTASIADDAFGNSLQNVVLKIKDRAASGSGATAVVADTLDIGKSLRGKSTLVTLDLDLGVEVNPGWEAFKGDANLTTAKFASITVFDEEVFSGCKKLSYLDTGAAEVTVEKGKVDFTDARFILWGAFAGTEAIEKIDLTLVKGLLNGGTPVAGQGLNAMFGSAIAGNSAWNYTGNAALGNGNRTDGLYVPGSFEGSGVKEVLLPNTTVEIGTAAFKNCKSLKTVSFKNANEGFHKDPPSPATEPYGYYIFASAFEGCSSLVTFGNRNDVWDGTKWKEVVNVPAGATGHTVGGTYRIGYFGVQQKAFKDCTSIKEVKFSGEGADVYDADIFEGCTSLKKFTVVSSTKIASYGGANPAYGAAASLPLSLSNVEEVVLDCQAVGSVKFVNLPKLETLTFNKTLADVATGGSNDPAVEGVIPASAFLAGSTPNLKNLKLTDSDQTLTSAFVNLPSTVTKLIVSDSNGDTTGGTGLTLTGTSNAQIFPKSVKYVDFLYAVGSLTTPFAGLEEYSIGVNTASITVSTFTGTCTNNELVEVYIGKGVDATDNLNVDTNFFSSKLREFIVDPDNKKYGSDAGVLYTKTGSALTGLARYPQAKTAQSYSIPVSTLSIGASAFEKATWLEEITIPAKVNSIGATPFKDCSNLVTVNYNAERVTTFTIPTSGSEAATSTFPVSVGKEAKEWHVPDTPATQAKYGKGSGRPGSFNIGEGVIEIPKGFLSKANEGITSITIPSTVKVIPHSATEMENPFKNLPKLAEVTYKANVFASSGDATTAGQNFEIFALSTSAVTLIDGTTTTPTANFTRIVFSDNVTYIPQGAFKGANISSLTLPKYVEQIDKGAFQNCNRITDMTIPAPAEGKALIIQDNAFLSCNGPNAVTFLSGDVIIGANTSFDGTANYLKVLYEGANGGAGKYTYSTVGSGTWTKE